MHLDRTHWTLIAFIGLLLTLFQMPSGSTALPSAVDGEKLPSLAPMLEKVIPGVVNISTLTHITQERHPLLRDPLFRWFFDVPNSKQIQKKENSLGSGVIIDAAKGHILTNHHVIDQADEIHIKLHDGRKLKASLIGSDPETDIALLKVEPQNLSEIRLSDSNHLRVGDFVVAIGNPFGLGQTVTSGIVSALERSGLGIEGYESFIQTDASINPGNSGGPLVNLRGELIGINTAILAPSGGNVGIGFAIPVNMASAIMKQLLAYGEVRRGAFGIDIQTLTPELADAMDIKMRSGAMITAVAHQSAAAKTGIETGDVVTTINGTVINSASGLRNQLGLLTIGEQFRLTLVRQGKTLNVTGTIEDPYEHYVPGEKIHPYFQGALLGDVEDKSTFGVYQAVEVGKIAPGSAAMQFGLRKGDVILYANQQRVNQLRTLTQILRQTPRQLTLKIRRDDSLFILSN